MSDVYQTGESIGITATIVDVAGTAADPSTTTISIQKPDGTLDITDVAMTQSVSGTYTYNYMIPSGVGLYRAQVKATGSAGRITIEPDRFLVEAAIS
jgi:uncharacterized protein YfaS (alpha-2-macroglobulin family)